MARTSGSHSDTTRRKVRQAATRLFAQHGYAAVSMRQIAAEVGVQVGALYNYTPDKQTLLFDLMHMHLDALLEAFEDVPDATPETRLRQFVRFHIRFHANRPDEVFIAYMELRNLNQENFATIASLRGRYEAFLQAIIDDGVARGVFRVADTKIATLALVAMLTGVVTWFREDGRLSLSDIEHQYWIMVKGALNLENRS